MVQTQVLVLLQPRRFEESNLAESNPIGGRCQKYTGNSDMSCPTILDTAGFPDISIIITLVYYHHLVETFEILETI